MKKVILYTINLGLVILFGASVYIIIPFPGSQLHEAIDFANYLVSHIQYFRLAGMMLLIYPTYHFIVHGPTTYRVLVASVARTFHPTTLQFQPS
jgi:hypothetical protein